MRNPDGIYFLTRAVTLQGDGTAPAWSREETTALVAGVCDVVLGRSLPPPPHTSGWPSHKDEKFWEACVKSVVDATDLPKCR